MDKIIQTNERIILIKKELTNPEEWKKLFDSLTFAEGMAMSKAMEEWSRKYMKVIERS